jgi:hypothetical protein
MTRQERFSRASNERTSPWRANSGPSPRKADSCIRTNCPTCSVSRSSRSRNSVSCAKVDVGTASGDTTYARYRLGSSATSGYLASATPKRASQEAWTGNPPIALSDYAGHVALNTARIPKDTAFVITLKAGVGGTPAGTGIVYVVIKWF